MNDEELKSSLEAERFSSPASSNPHLLRAGKQFYTSETSVRNAGAGLAKLLRFQAARKRAAFTLAEVLITLSIIGIVAALTIPTLVQHYKRVETASRLKKFYSMMQQAIKFSEIDNNEATTWTKADTQTDTDGNVDGDAQNIVVKEFFMKYLAPYLKFVKYEDGKSTVDDEGNKGYEDPVIYLADGSSITIWNGGCMDFIYDVNGNKNPNVDGRDMFVFTLCFTDSLRKTLMKNKDVVFGPLTVYNGYNWIFSSRNNAMTACKEAPANCAALIMYDGWEIKDDYPYKL